MINDSPDFDEAARYAAYAARDSRFDGIFFIGVTSTGIYCRPICTARTPRADRCRFFGSAAAAEEEGFRPCLRCRPERAPGFSPVDGAARTAARIADRISQSIKGGGIGKVASEFHIGPRQLHRLLRRELGVSPMGLLMTRRLLAAKQLLTETGLPISQVATASGFSSLRRFNDAFNKRYGMPPGRLRRQDPAAASSGERDSFTIRLSYRDPYDWDGMLDFLRTRALPGVEVVEGSNYARTMRLGAETGWVRATNSDDMAELEVEVAMTLLPILPELIGRLRHLFDLDARPDVISGHLGGDSLVGRSVEANPGLRVPGSFDGFELAVRAILGQQITVKAATRLADRLAAELGEPFVTPLPGLCRLAPCARRLASTEVGQLRSFGIISRRSECIIRLAREVAEGRLALDPGADVESTMSRLTSLPGIGPWTASYIAMRALRWPDAFPRDDVAVRNRLGGVSPAEAERLSMPWRPWRSYALLHLWRAASNRLTILPGITAPTVAGALHAHRTL